MELLLQIKIFNNLTLLTFVLSKCSENYDDNSAIEKDRGSRRAG